MRYYEYDAQGFLVGSHGDPARPNSTTADPAGIPPSRAKWNGTTWIEDASRETQRSSDEATERAKLQQAIDACKNYNPATAAAGEVRQTLGAALLILRRVCQELR